MPMEEALVTRLNQTLAIADLVADGVSGAPGRQAISWFGRQRGDPLPAVVLTKVSPGRDYNHCGPDGMDRPRVQIDCLASAGAAAIALARAVRAEMEAVRTVVMADGAVWFEAAEVDGEGWLFDGEQDGGEALFRCSQDFIFLTKEL